MVLLLVLLSVVCGMQCYAQLIVPVPPSLADLSALRPEVAINPRDVRYDFSTNNIIGAIFIGIVGTVALLQALRLLWKAFKLKFLTPTTLVMPAYRVSSIRSGLSSTFVENDFIKNVIRQYKRSWMTGDLFWYKYLWWQTVDITVQFLYLLEMGGVDVFGTEGFQTTLGNREITIQTTLIVVDMIIAPILFYKNERILSVVLEVLVDFGFATGQLLVAGRFTKPNSWYSLRYDTFVSFVASVLPAAFSLMHILSIDRYLALAAKYLQSNFTEVSKIRASSIMVPCITFAITLFTYVIYRLYGIDCSKEIAGFDTQCLIPLHPLFDSPRCDCRMAVVDIQSQCAIDDMMELKKYRRIEYLNVARLTVSSDTNTQCESENEVIQETMSGYKNAIVLIVNNLLSGSLAITKIPSLQIIGLRVSKIDNLPSDLHLRFPDIHVLDFQLSLLEELPFDSLRQMTKLKSLMLTGSPICNVGNFPNWLNGIVDCGFDVFTTTTNTTNNDECQVTGPLQNGYLTFAGACRAWNDAGQPGICQSLCGTLFINPFRFYDTDGDQTINATEFLPLAYFLGIIELGTVVDSNDIESAVECLNYICGGLEGQRERVSMEHVAVVPEKVAPNRRTSAFTRRLSHAAAILVKDYRHVYYTVMAMLLILLSVVCGMQCYAQLIVPVPPSLADLSALRPEVAINPRDVRYDFSTNNIIGAIFIGIVGTVALLQALRLLWKAFRLKFLTSRYRIKPTGWTSDRRSRLSSLLLESNFIKNVIRQYKRSWMTGDLFWYKYLWWQTVDITVQFLYLLEMGGVDVFGTEGFQTTLGNREITIQTTLIVVDMIIAPILFYKNERILSVVLEVLVDFGFATGQLLVAGRFTKPNSWYSLRYDTFVSFVASVLPAAFSLMHILSIDRYLALAAKYPQSNFTEVSKVRASSIMVPCITFAITLFTYVIYRLYGIDCSKEISGFDTQCLIPLHPLFDSPRCDCRMAVVDIQSQCAIDDMMELRKYRRIEYLTTARVTTTSTSTVECESENEVIQETMSGYKNAIVLRLSTLLKDNLTIGHLPALKVLTARPSRLTSVPADMHLRYPMLRTIDFQLSLLEELPFDSLRQMTKLESLMLTGSPICNVGNFPSWLNGIVDCGFDVFTTTTNTTNNDECQVTGPLQPLYLTFQTACRGWIDGGRSRECTPTCQSLFINAFRIYDADGNRELNGAEFLQLASFLGLLPSGAQVDPSDASFVLGCTSNMCGDPRLLPSNPEVILLRHWTPGGFASQGKTGVQVDVVLTYHVSGYFPCFGAGIGSASSLTLVITPPDDALTVLVETKVVSDSRPLVVTKWIPDSLGVSIWVRNDNRLCSVETKLVGEIYRPRDHFDARIEWPECPFPVAMQGMCGSCFAIVVSTVGTDRVCVENERLIRRSRRPLPADEIEKQRSTYPKQLSPQPILSCGNLGGCGGGSPFLAIQYSQRNGLPDSEHCPYLSAACTQEMDGRRDGCHKCSELGLGSSKILPLYHFRPVILAPNEAVMMRTVQETGSVIVSFRAHANFQEFFMFNRFGLYTTTAGSPEIGNHAVRIIGFGVEDNVPFWLLMNSWGNDWGEHGCFRMLRGRNLCGIEELPVGMDPINADQLDSQFPIIGPINLLPPDILSRLSDTTAADAIQDFSTVGGGSSGGSSWHFDQQHNTQGLTKAHRASTVGNWRTQDPNTSYWTSFFERHKPEILETLEIDSSGGSTLSVEELESQVVFGTLIHMHLKIESPSGLKESDVYLHVDPFGKCDVTIGGPGDLPSYQQQQAESDTE
ncbi:hypothetical protein FOL47_008518 [Perkinsus chesapeaki]|uniref:EF-hand domain-containing protein n=1 Tax=Perkinsus chesapeaki TaxID=330153 RepID=A0A7J6MTL5_PERCH|nr:hypothetical protein FOL47_008518 [Perkinsus chesapeaki]